MENPKKNIKEIATDNAIDGYLLVVPIDSTMRLLTMVYNIKKNKNKNKK